MSNSEQKLVCPNCKETDCYLDSKGYRRCRTCRKEANNKLAIKKREENKVLKKCPIHRTERYLNNFGDEICRKCVKENKKKRAEEKRKGPPPTNCQIHNLPRRWSSEGIAICRQCINDKSVRRRENKIKNNILPEPCSIHNIDRSWSYDGTPYCSQCNKQKKLTNYKNKIKGPPPLNCPIHNCERKWNSEGSAYCVKCVKEKAKKLFNYNKSLGNPTPCEKHKVDRRWNSFGRPVCNKCILESAHKRGEIRKTLGNPTKCLKHNEKRYWDKLGRAICRKCFKENVVFVAKKRKEGDPPEKCLIHNLPRTWKNDGRPVCQECSKDYRNTLDKLYYKWYSINRRCHNPNDEGYGNYGGRGIFVYSPWRRNSEDSHEVNYSKYLKFKEWVLSNIGNIPSNEHSLDRIDNNRGYEPGNIRWATDIDQANNTRNNYKYKFGVLDNALVEYPEGSYITIKEFSEIMEMPLIVLKYRYSKHPQVDYLLNDNYDNRFYQYGNYKYNLSELCLISKIPYKTMEARIRKMNWDIERAINTPSPRVGYKVNPLER